PPPTPWTTRAAISSGSECATAASSVPAARITSVQTSTRSLPNMSPRRPRIGGAQVVLDRRQGRDDRRAEHGVGETAEREDGERQPRMRPRAVHAAIL